MNSDDNYKYYGNYDKNIKSIKGGGVITPSNPPNRKKTTGTVKNTWNKNIKITPPLYKSVYYSDPLLTNGYLNSNNYIISNDNISDYYYPSQKLDPVIIDDNPQTQNIINNLNPIKLPPPLVNSKYNKIKIQKKNKKKLNDDDYKFINFIKNNSLYDGKYIYTIENELLNTLDNFSNNKTFIPFTNKLIKLDNELNINNNDDAITNSMDKFENIEISNNNSIFSNVVLLLIFSIMLIIYFSKQKK